MSLTNDLTIFLITYNRLKKLQYTVKRLLESPIKDYDIKILDNCSEDGTQEFCEKFVQEHQNFKYIRNKINLGISGNIIRAMELASKKWLWVLCDDDDFDWNNWGEIEEALHQDYDIVHTTYSPNFRSEEYAYLINEEAFIPTCIYNTKHITPLTMQNAYAMAYTLLPHHAIGCKVINEKGKIYVPQNRCVLQGMDDKFNFIRMPRKGMFHRIDDYQILAGYIGAYQLIEDEEIRNQCCNVLCLGSDFIESMNWFLDTNPRQNLYNVFEILLTVSDEKKVQLAQKLSEKGYTKFYNIINLCAGYFNVSINYNLMLKTFLQNIFSVKNEVRHNILRIFGIRIKLRRKRVANNG